jgi:hypothetical protein
MFTLIITWIGIALGTTLLLLMALGPVIVELDSWLASRRRTRRRLAHQPKVTTRPATQM